MATNKKMTLIEQYLREREKAGMLNSVITSYAVDGHGNIDPAGMLDEIQARIDGVMGQIDAVFPRFWLAMEKMGLNFCYMVDGEVEGIPRGSDVTTNSVFSIAETTLYFDEPGSRLSLPHELGHALDVFSSVELFARSLSLVYPKPMSARELLASWSASVDMQSDDGVFLHAIHSARIASEPDIRRTVVMNMLKGGPWEGADIATNDFVQERWAHLFEQFIYFSLHSTGKEPAWFNADTYGSKSMWEYDYLEGKRKQVGLMFRRAVKNILGMPVSEIDAKKGAYSILAGGDDNLAATESLL